MLYRHLMWDDHGYGEPPMTGGHYELDLTYPPLAYFYGLALSDGSIRQDHRNSGAVAIELSSRDAAPLNYFDEAFPWKGRLAHRTRPSPFGPTDHATVAYVSHAIDLRSQMIARGFPIGSKSRSCGLPIGAFDQKAFWRGYFDGDGSLGFSAVGIPFLSLTTMSSLIAEAYLELLERVTGRRPLSRPNRRDEVWNIMVMRGRAGVLAEYLYTKGALAIPRKALLAERIMAGDWEADAPWRKKKRGTAVKPKGDANTDVVPVD